MDRTLRLARDPRAVVNLAERGRMCSNKKISACARTVQAHGGQGRRRGAAGVAFSWRLSCRPSERLVTAAAVELDGISRWRGRGKLGVAERHTRSGKSTTSQTRVQAPEQVGASATARRSRRGGEEGRLQRTSRRSRPTERKARTMRRHNYAPCCLRILAVHDLPVIVTRANKVGGPRGGDTAR